MYVSRADKNGAEKERKRNQGKQANSDAMDAIDGCDASRCQPLNVSASHDLKVAKLFIAPDSRVPANIVFLVSLKLISERRRANSQS